MHDTAYEIGSMFIALHAPKSTCVIVELGASNVNGTLRDFNPPQAIYFGLDVQHGPGVDLLVAPGETLPLRDDFADLLISTSQMEHDPCFWNTFLELARVLKPGGLLYFSAPSNGPYHCYPVDLWRFYPDAGLALAQWSARSGKTLTLVESFTAERKADIWNDYVCVFRKGEAPADADIPLLSDHIASTNVRTYRSNQIERAAHDTEDFRIMETRRLRIEELEADLSNRAARKGELEADLSRSAARAGELESMLAESHARLEKLQSAVDEAQARIRELEAAAHAPPPPGEAEAAPSTSGPPAEPAADALAERAVDHATE